MSPAEREILDRLRRIEGQIGGVLKMQHEGRYCIDVLDQISAARAALAPVALLILERHVETCVHDALEAGQGAEKGAELTAAVRRFVKSV